MSKKFLFALLIFITIFSISANAQTINDALRIGYPGLGSNARALGMGNAYIGLSDDASSSFFNPAGLGLLRRMEFSGGLDFSSFDNQTTLFNSASSDNNNSARLNRLSFALPIPTVRGSLVLGISYQNVKDFNQVVKFDAFNPNNSWIQAFTAQNNNLPYDLYLSNGVYDTSGNYIGDFTNINGRLQQSGDILYEGGLHNWTFSGAVEVQKNLFLGLNVNINTGSFESNNDYYEEDIKNVYTGELIAGEPTTNDFQKFHINRRTIWDISGWDAKFGMLYQLNNFARFGLAVQFPKFVNIKEEFLVSAESQFANKTYEVNPDDFSDKVEYQIITPFTFEGGFAVNYAGLIFSAQASMTDYSQLQFDKPVGIQSIDLENRNKDIKDQLDVVINYNLGLEYIIPRTGFRLRGGYFVQPSAFKNDNSDYDKKYLTAGLGLLANETLAIDFGFVHGWWKDFGENYGTGLSTTHQSIKLNKYVLTTTFRF